MVRFFFGLQNLMQNNQSLQFILKTISCKKDLEKNHIILTKRRDFLTQFKLFFFLKPRHVPSIFRRVNLAAQPEKTCSYYPTSCSLGSPSMSYALFLIGLKSRGPIWTLRYLLQRPPTNPHLEMSLEKLKSKYLHFRYLRTYYVIS